MFHQILGEYLAGFDAGGFGIRSEAGNAGLVQPVDAAQRQRIIRRHNSKINLMRFCKFNNGRDILCPYLRNANRILCDAAVAGQDVDGLNLWILFQLFYDGVLAATAADDQKIHEAASLHNISDGTDAYR